MCSSEFLRGSLDVRGSKMTWLNSIEGYFSTKKQWTQNRFLLFDWIMTWFVLTDQERRRDIPEYIYNWDIAEACILVQKERNMV